MARSRGRVGGSPVHADRLNGRARDLERSPRTGAVVGWGERNGRRESDLLAFWPRRAASSDRTDFPLGRWARRARHRDRPPPDTGDRTMTPAVHTTELS